MGVLRKLQKNKQFWFITLITFLFFILRLPSLFEPLWYGDEGIYQVIGTSLNHGKLLYSEAFDNKPPLLYWLYSFLQSDQFTIRLTSLIFGALSVITFFLLARKLLKNKYNNFASYLATFIFTVLFGLSALEGNIANAENFMLLPILIAALIISTFNFSLKNRISNLKLLTAGILLGMAFLFKIVAVFDFFAFFVFYLILSSDSLKKEIRLPLLITSFVLPLFLVSLLFIINGTFIDFVKAAFIANISYVNYGNKIGDFPFFLFIKLLLLGGFTFFAFLKRKTFNRSTLFISIWFAFSLFNAFFSQRPYTHYLLVLISSLSLMIGLIFYDNKNQKIIIISLIIALLAVIKVFGIPNFGKSIRYYQNFISYTIGSKTMVQYQAFFDRNTPFDYEIARFIKPKLSENDTIFLWGNNAQLYQLVNVVAPTKYVVAYHIINYKDGSITTQASIKTTKPKFIVVMSNAGPIPFPLISYSKKIDIKNASIYERIF